jgi:HlyD family secretion protein
MKRWTALFLIALAGLALTGCFSPDAGTSFTGYVEGEFVLVGPDDGGRLTTLSVAEGDTIRSGEPLFDLDAMTEEAALNAAKAKLEQAEASLKLSKVGLKRAEQLLERGVVAQSRLDDARSAYDRDQAAVAAAGAELEDAETRLARRRIAAPVTGAVQEVYFRPGEYVGAGQSIVALLPPGNVKVRFYVPEPARAAMRTGEKVLVGCDGCAEGLSARISFVSREAEYAPPVIFSREERRKLVYMVEAVPDGEARNLPVGQPVTVSIPGQNEAIGP